MSVSKVLSSAYLLVKSDDIQIKKALNELNPSERKLLVAIINGTSQERIAFENNPKTAGLATKLEGLTQGVIQKKHRGIFSKIVNKIINSNQGTTRNQIVAELKGLSPQVKLPPKKEVHFGPTTTLGPKKKAEPEKKAEPAKFRNPVKELDAMLNDPSTMFPNYVPRKKPEQKQ